MGEQADEQQPAILIPQEHLAGVWANRAIVSHTLHEFTLDVVRMDGTAPPPGRGIVVARVSLSPLLVTELMDALDREWRVYAESTFPKEVLDGDEGTKEAEPDS